MGKNTPAKSSSIRGKLRRIKQIDGQSKMTGFLRREQKASEGQENQAPVNAGITNDSAIKPDSEPKLLASTLKSSFSHGPGGYDPIRQAFWLVNHAQITQGKATTFIEPGGKITLKIYSNESAGKITELSSVFFTPPNGLGVRKKGLDKNGCDNNLAANVHA